MKRFMLIIVVVFMFGMLTACGPEENTEILDFSTFTEVLVEPTIMELIYSIEEVELTSDNQIYIVVDEEIYQGKFIAIEEGNTLFSIKTKIDFFYWYEALDEGLVKCYYK